MSRAVRADREGAVMRLCIDRPEQRNALNDEAVDGLLEELADDATRPETRVVVLTGSGDRAFCAGGDLTSTMAPVAGPGEPRGRGRIGDLLLALQRHPKPVLARVNGHALAGGFGLMLACDLVVACDGAEFGTPEATLGLWPFMISAVIRRNLPRKVAAELMLTGRRMPAAEALSWGIVNRVVPFERLDAEVEDLVAALVRSAPLALAMGKESFLRSEDMDLDEAMAYLREMLATIARTEDVAEGVSAFLQRRRPEWKGR